MEIKQEGQILELDPSKTYVMIVKRKSCLAKMLHSLGTRKLMRGGSILLIDSFKEFRFVENSDRIKDIILED